MENNSCAEYMSLCRRVRSGSLEITFINGLPRGGTTAFERFCFEGLDQRFDANVNQPGLLPRVPDGKVRDRQQTMWKQVLDHVLACEAKRSGESDSTMRDLGLHPIRIVVKETTNVVMPNEAELMNWQRLCKSVILIVRNPHLQCESRIICIADRILSGAMRNDLHIDSSLDPDTFAVHGLPLIKPGAVLSYGTDASATNLSAWEQHYQLMKTKRDYSSLDQGYTNFCGLHPLFEEPQAQSAIWQTYATKMGLARAHEQITTWTGTKLEKFHMLPAWMRTALFEWRFGWACLKAQMDCLTACGNVHIFDFSECQAAPDHLKAVLNSICFGTTGENCAAKKRKKGEDEKITPHSFASSAAVRPKIPPLQLESQGSDVPPSTFDVGNGKSAEWDAWFHGPCFAQHANQTCAIRAPNKAPCSADALPVYLQRLMPQFMEIYKDVRKDPRFIHFPPAILSKHDGVDPIFDDVRQRTD